MNSVVFQFPKALFCVGAIFCFSAQASVTIFSPADGSTVSSPSQVNASVSAGSVPTYLYVYDNGSQVSKTRGSSSLSASLSLTPGSHTLTVQATYRHSSPESTSVTVEVPNTDTPTSGSGVASVAQQIGNDMVGQNEARAHQLPSGWDWAQHPTVALGNTPPSGWTALLPWGIVFEASEGNPAVNTLVNIRNMQLWLFSKSRETWTLLSDTDAPSGAMYLETFANDSNHGATIRKESDGSISVTAGGGYCFHFYPGARSTINPTDIGGVVTVFEARLIVDDASKADDRNIARFAALSGADYWPNLTSNESIETPDVGTGKIKYVQSEWRSFAMTSMSLSDLTKNPPPVDLTGIAP